MHEKLLLCSFEARGLKTLIDNKAQYDNTDNLHLSHKVFVT